MKTLTQYAKSLTVVNSIAFLSAGVLGYGIVDFVVFYLTHCK